MTMERVSFAKPVEPKPRLSEKYIPGRHSRRFWSEQELQVLRDHFEEKGAQYCRGLLPGRSTGSIYQIALKLHLKNRVAAPKRHIKTSPEMDEQIREEWRKLTGNNRKGEVGALADKLNVPRWWLSARANTLGLVIPRMTKEPVWSAAELDLLKRTPLSNLKAAVQVFSDNGFSRTPASLMCKSKRLGISRRYKGTLSATAAAKILGVDAKNFTLWIAKGVIKATKRETQRLPQQGGHPWSIERADFRQFIIDHLEPIDFRKVDKYALVAILTEGA